MRVGEGCFVDLLSRSGDEAVEAVADPTSGSGSGSGSRSCSGGEDLLGGLGLGLGVGLGVRLGVGLECRGLVLLPAPRPILPNPFEVLGGDWDFLAGDGLGFGSAMGTCFFNLGGVS